MVMASKNKTLNNVCEFIVDCLHKTAPTQEEGYPSIRTPNVGRGRLILDGVYRVSEETYHIWTQRAVPEQDDLIMAREAPAGNVAIIKNGHKVCLGQRTVHLRPDTKQVDPDFLCYYLLAPKQQGMLLAGETGATAGHVNMRDIRRLPMDGLPPLKVQQKAGKLLAAYDDLLENNARRIRLLEASARLLYEEWFVRLRFPGHEHTPIHNALPKGWQPKVLCDLCQTVRETVHPNELEPDTPYIGLEHIPRRSITLGTWGRAEDVDSTKHRYRAGDILFGKIRAYFHKVGIALTDGVASSDAIVIRPESDALLPLILMTTSSDHFVRTAAQTAREGSKMPRADWKLMQQFDVPMPPAPILEAFNDFITPILGALKALTFTNQKLQQARDLLLPRLMNGEISV